MSKEEREELDQDGFFLNRMLKRNAEHVFTEKDLHNEDVLNRSIDLFRPKAELEPKSQPDSFHDRYQTRHLLTQRSSSKAIFLKMSSPMLASP